MTYNTENKCIDDRISQRHGNDISTQVDQVPHCIYEIFKMKFRKMTYWYFVQLCLFRVSIVRLRFTLYSIR